ncbi:hypothetical protein H9Q72_012980 [Fusarium xylarioides]|uniref:Uncharacterized protein n=1 Tax=Fusarium xylarioides TaxID=221167 RepID=A0A9P7HKX1_9HYPO|nr:hypothetical protein H9Q72_012980 [Fusarium xylarioides]
MARKRSRKSKKQGTSRGQDGRVWTNSHRLELLAFLNWCVQQDKGPDFYTTVTDHLKQTTKKNFAKVEIQKKLWDEWRKRGTCPKFAHLYTLGTAGLGPLGVEDQRELELISLRLEREPRPTGQESQTQCFSQSEELEDNLRQDEFPAADNADVVAGDVSELFAPPSADLEPNDVGTIFVSEPPPIPSIEAKLRIELLNAKGRELTLMNKVSELERERDDRDQNERVGPIDPSAARRVISRLQNRVKAYQSLDDDFELLESGRFAFMGSSLRSECQGLYEDINLSISSSMCNLSSKYDLPEQRSDFSPLSHSWAKRILGGDMSALLTHAHEATVPENKLIAALLTAGIFNLIFESDFPEMLSIDSPFFIEYRRLVSISAGRHKAHKIELAAINSVFTNKEVKNKMINDKAKCLSSIILQTLDFFIPSNSHGMSERPYDSHSDAEKLAVTALEDDSLSQALRIKVQLGLSDKRIKYFFFKPGTLFDGAIMECDISQIRVPANGRLKLCVFPVLFSVPDGDENQEDQGSRFGGHDGGMTEAMVSDLELLVLVAKARVLF